MSRHTLLYTEMVTAAALVHGDHARLLHHSDAEHPVAVQLGGSDPVLLRHATDLCASAGFREIDLNVGCPSDRVQSGAFGAILMKSPDLVADCVNQMQQISSVEITVKCRIGVDDQNPEDVLSGFLEKMQTVGVKRVTIHARKAWLKGLSPKENRDIPPLDYGLVHRMKAQFPNLHISINGGIASLDAASQHLVDGLDGVMIGRAAYHTPAEILLNADRLIFKTDAPAHTALDVGRAMVSYIDDHLHQGGRLHHITRHMLGLFAGAAGARNWRRTLSALGADEAAGTVDYQRALDAVEDAQNIAKDYAERQKTEGAV